MKRIHEPIDVTLSDDGVPRAWYWRRQLWRVLRVLDRWVLQARWWTDNAGASGEKRDYLLVEAAPTTPGSSSDDHDDTCAVEIYWRGDGDAGHVTDAWILARILH